MATEGRGVLRASIFGVELGLFRVLYRGLAVADDLPTYQFGNDASDAKRRIETSVTALGYDAIAWEDATVAAEDVDAPAELRPFAAE